MSKETETIYIVENRYGIAVMAFEDEQDAIDFASLRDDHYVKELDLVKKEITL